MLTPNEKNIQAKTTDGTMRLSINRLPTGQYRVQADYYDRDGYYIAHKATVRICNTINDLII